jgi:glycosyltransferase involved in cell wall biosynthesis
MRAASFAIPGDITTLTGGYIYERRLLEGLRAQGRAVAHIELGASFPDPTPRDMADAIERLAALPPDEALILDGLVSGAIDTAGLARVRGPVVGMVHHPLALETGLNAARRAHLFRTERDNLALMTHVLVPSPHTAEILRDRYDVPEDRITIARPGTERYAGNVARTRIGGPPLILSVGIQHPRKGHDILLRALSRIVDLDWRAVVVGGRYDPEHATALDRLHVDLGLAGRVDLAGRVSDRRLQSLYAEATIFALATRYEGYGIVFDEALLRGLPIVSCATGAVARTVPADAGLLVQPDDAAAFAAALRRVLTDCALRDRMADAAAEAGADLPGWEDTARIAGEVLDALPG